MTPVLLVLHRDALGVGFNLTVGKEKESTTWPTHNTRFGPCARYSTSYLYVIILYSTVGRLGILYVGSRENPG